MFLFHLCFLHPQDLTFFVCQQALPEPELDAESRAAFDTAYDNIRAFHEAQRAADVEVETMPGVHCRRVTRPIGVLHLRSTWLLLSRCKAPAEHKTQAIAFLRAKMCLCCCLDGPPTQADWRTCSLDFYW